MVLAALAQLACAAALGEDPYAQNRTVLAHNLARRFDPEHGLLAGAHAGGNGFQRRGFSLIDENYFASIALEPFNASMARALNRSLVHWLRPLPPSASGLMDRRQNLLGRRTEPIYGSDTVTLAGKNEKNSEFVVYTEDINPNVTFTTERLGTGVNHMVPLLLARWMASDLAAATSVFRHVAGLWNGTGFLDGAAVQAGRFSTRDLTYFLWAERATAGVRGFETDPAMVAAVEAQLWALQACEEGTALAVSYSGQGEALCPPHDGWGVGEQLVSIEANAMALALTDPRMRTVWFPRKTDDTLTSHTDGDSFSVAIVEHSATPVLSASNAKGNGSSPCLVFNAAYIPAVPGSGMATSGVLVRMCCGSNQFCFDCGSTASGDKTCNGRHPTTPVWKPGANLGPNPWSGPIPFPNRPPERVSFAPCDLATGLCADVNTSFIMDPRAFGGGETDSIMIEDPRAFHYAETGYYYNFYWRGRGDLKGCVGDQKLCNVALSKTKTPLVAGSWELVTHLPWVRNGCCHMTPKGEKSFCIWGSGPDGCHFPPGWPTPSSGSEPCNGFLPGLGISYTTDIDSGNFTQVPFSVADGVHSPLTNDSMFMRPLGLDHGEVHLEAGAPPQLLSNGDFIHFYAGMTPGFSACGNWSGKYTASWVILEGADPSRIVGRWAGKEAWMLPTKPYETLCHGKVGCKYGGENPETIFLSSATPTGRNKDEFRLWFGAGDGNVGTALVQEALPADRAAPQALKTDEDIELVRQRLLSSILSNTGSADSGASLSASDATSFAKLLQPDGSWPDVNYTDRTRTGAWSPEKHLRRQLTMAIVARKTNDTTLVNAVHRALDFFLARSAPNGTTFPFGEIHSSNWFCGEIWTPSMLGNLALAFEPWLTAHETQVTVAIMMRSNWAKYKRTGANLVSELSTQIKRGALLRNRSIVAAAFDRMWEGVRVSPPHGQTNGTDCMYEGCQTDGIQADRSYHQHGPQLLAGSYGSYTARETVISLGLAAGTSFTMDRDRTELFVELLLDGMRWMMVHQLFWDWSVVGRSLGSHIARPCCVGNSTGGLGDYLASIPSKRSAELKSFAAAMASGESAVASGATPLRGHRAYWCSDFAVQSSESPFDGSPWVATLLMHSNRTTAAACVNGQGAMNEHLADSMMYLYYNGTEYDGIFGSWDWLKLPGITAEQIPIRSCNYSTQQKLDSARMPMTGTVTTGIEGLSAMSLVAHNLTAKKCVAMLQHAIVSLVADVKCASNNVVITTIDSSISPGDVFVSVDGEDTPQRVSVGTVGKEFANVEWIHHNRTGYFTTFSDASYRSIEITHAMVSSTNRRILFEAGFNHGTNVTGLLEHAGWITVPGMSLAQMQAGVRPNVTIVSNTKDTQAVMDHAKSQGMAAIWTRGASVAFPLPLFSVSSSSPATIIVTKLADGSVNITAADPSNDKDGLELHLVLSKHGLVGEDCKPRADGSTAVTINLPTGWDAGRSTSVLCASTHAP